MVECLCGGRVAGNKDRSRSFKVRGWELSTTGSNHDGIEARRENPKLGENTNFGIMDFFEKAGGSGNIFTGYQNSSGHQNGSGKIFGIDHGLEICRKGQKSRKSTKKLEKHEVDRPSTRCLRACNRSMLIDMCVLVWLLACTPGMHPDMWEEWWRPPWVMDMHPDMWSTRCRRACVRSHAKRNTGCHQPEADWLVSPINTPRPQLISSHPNLSKPSHSVPLMIKWRCCPELVQFYGFRSVEVLLDTPPGSPKNCPEAKGGSVRVQISLSRPVSFFLVKPRLCP
ncbi:hypothetical protein YC2023_010648 [Brassica napus]